jgi:polyhydroxyalkanoate synthase
LAFGIQTAPLNDGDLTFVLTSGGHNAGIISQTGHPRRHFRTRHANGGPNLGADEWEQTTLPQAGSWWLRGNKMAQQGPWNRSASHRRTGFMPTCDAGTHVLQT